MTVEGTRVEDAYPLPWRWEETWTGTDVMAANDKRVVKITKGRSGNRIDEEQVLAELIVRCVNAAASSEIAKWYEEGQKADADYDRRRARSRGRVEVKG